MEDRQYEIEIKRLEIEQSRLELERLEFENKKAARSESTSMFWKIFNELTRYLHFQTVIDVARLPEHMQDAVFSLEDRINPKELGKGDNET